jgi:hypothetical protein
LGAQQFLDLSAEENVAGTGLVEKGRPALRRVLLDRRQEDCFHLGGLLAHHLRSRGTDAALHTNADFGCGFSHEGRQDLQKNCSNETALIVGTMTHAKPLPKEQYPAPGL